MKNLERNNKTVYYCLYDGFVDKEDEYGNLTGETIEHYQPHKKMKQANVSEATGNSNAEQFGVSVDYDKVVLTQDMKCPITETTVLFVDKKPEYDDNGLPLYDYVVKRVSRSLNVIAIAIKRVDVT